MFTIRDNAIHADTRTLTAVIDRGWLTELRSKLDGESYLADIDPGQGSALQLLYPGQGTMAVMGLASEVSAHQLSPTCAQLRFSGWDADGVLTVSEDLETGDVLVEPSAYSSRPGALSCRWQMPGVRPDLEVVAPFFQGVKLPLNDPLLTRRWFWPQFWEAGLVILQGRDSGFWVHCRDDRYRYKALNIADSVLGFETEAYGPVDASLGAGGLTWRINVYQGSWEVPAARYRDWLWRAYGLDGEQRKPWVDELRFALSWYNGDPDILDAVAEKVDPRRVLIHFSQWRTDGYDENYPTYEPSPKARETFAKAQAMGFHIMPHCNAVDMDPTHPAYAYLRDFQYRDVQTKRLLGWGYDPQAGGVLGVPNSYHNLSCNRHRKVMVKVHPGLAMWRSILAEHVKGAADALATDTVFIDVTLCSHNLHNCLVENTTSTEWGMHSSGPAGERADNVPKNANLWGMMHRAVRLIYYAREDLVRGASSWQMLSGVQAPGFGVLSQQAPDKRFLVYWLYYHFNRHIGDTVLATDGTAPYYIPAEGDDPATRAGEFPCPLTPLVVTLSGDGRTLYLVAANGSWDRTVPCRMSLRNFAPGQATGLSLSGDPDGSPLLDSVDQAVKALPVTVAGDAVQVDLPARSAAFVTLQAR